MAGQRWRTRDDKHLSPETIEAIIRKEALIKMGVPVEGTNITASSRRRSYLLRSYLLLMTRAQCSWSNSSADYQPKKEVAQTYNKVVAQMRAARVPQSPLISEPVSEGEFVYPHQKVVNIRKGLQLRRKG